MGKKKNNYSLDNGFNRIIIIVLILFIGVLYASYQLPNGLHQSMNNYIYQTIEIIKNTLF